MYHQLCASVLMMLGVAVFQQDADTWAKTLVPMLASVRSSIEPKITVSPGKLPPSPITGRSAALFAIRIGRESVDVDEQVVATMDRLLQWDRQQPLPPEDRALITRWVDELRVKVLARLAASGKAVACDDVCLAQHLTKPETLFSGTATEREAERNAVLLDTLSTAVLSPALILEAQGPASHADELHWGFARP